LSLDNRCLGPLLYNNDLRSSHLCANQPGTDCLRFFSTLEPGKYADLVVLDRDFLAIPVDDIRYIEPVMTMVGGEIVYENADR